MFIDANRSIDVLYQALSQCGLSGPCSIFHNHLFKSIQAFPFQAHFVFFSDPFNRACPLVRSFKASLLIGALFLVCLFVCFVCLCRWLMRVEWMWFVKLWRAWRWRQSKQLFFGWRQVCPWSFVPIILLITIALPCINFDGFLLRMTSLIWPLS
jgi:hypothetical protein